MKNSRFACALLGALAFAAGVRPAAASGIVSFDWTSGKAVVTNETSDCEFPRPVCSWRLTVDGDPWSEGSVDLYPLPPRAATKVEIPCRRLPPTFAPAGYGRKRLALTLTDRGRVLDRRTFDRPGKPQLFPPTPERFRFDGDFLSKPYLQNAGTTGFTVCLETRRELADLRLVWTADGRERRTPFAFRKADFSGTFLARARVEGLKPGTRVSYEVAGEKGAFTTWTDGADDFKCAVFGDFQSGLSNGPKWWDWEQDPFLCGERMFADMVASGCEFAVGTGDLADTADYRKELRPLLIERTCGVMGSKIPFFIAFGNHDSIHPASHFFIESPMSDPSVSSFAFFRNNCLFACIDDAEVGDDKRPGRPELRVWFEKLMSSEAARKAKFRFLFQHVPFYVEANGNCVRWITDIAEKYGVDCVFSGDHHGYERITRGKTRQVVNGCMGYFDHGSEDVSGLVNWYGAETLAGGHCGMPKPTKWRFQQPGKPGVLGPETKVCEGLLPGYATLEVKGDTATWTFIAFNADGSKIGPVDSFTMKAGERPDAPKGIALERYCYAQSPKGKWLLKYTLTGKGGRTFVACEDDEWIRSRPIVEKDVVGVEFTDAAGRKKSYRLLPDNTIREGGVPAALPSRGLCAHRGDRSAFPENTVPAFRSAAAKGAAMVEFDVWRCKTGELVIMHDRTVDRTTTGTGAVERLSFDYLRSLDAGVKKGAQFRGTQIPTFDEAVDCLPKDGLWLNVHCKADVCDEVARKLKAKGRLRQAFVASDPKGVRAARKAVPEVKTCLMTGPWGRVWSQRETDDYVECAVTNRYEFAQPHCCALTPANAKRFHAAGGKFNFFWLSDPEKLPGLFSSGVDFPLVDDLDAMLAAYAAWEKAGCPKADYVPDTSYDGDIVSGNDWPTLAGTAWIEREVSDACASNAALQAALADRVSLERYRGLVRTVGGTNVWTAALQRALDEHEVVTVPAAAAPYWIDAPVLVPSNRRIEARGATVALLPGTRTLLLRNRNAKDGTLAPIPSGSRDTNIAVVGGVWTDWTDRRAGYGSTGAFDLSPRRHGNFFGVSSLFFFNNCDYVSVTDATFRRCSAFAVQAGDGNAHRYERIRFDDCFADGLHLNGNLTRVLCRDVRGKVGDDLVALNAYDWLSSSVDFGPQSLILCEDLELRLRDGKGYPAIRIQPAKYAYSPSNIVDCVISDVIFRRVKGIKTFKMYLQTPPYEIGGAHEWAEVGSGGNLHFEDIEIDLDAPIDNFGAYASSDPVRGHFGAFEFGANLTSVNFRNIDVTFHADRWPLSHLMTVGPKSVCDGKWETFDPYVSCTVKRVTLDGVRVRGAAPKDLVRPVSFDDVNRDGASTGRGRILRTVSRNGLVGCAARSSPRTD